MSISNTELGTRSQTQHTSSQTTSITIVNQLGYAGARRYGKGSCFLASVVCPAPDKDKDYTVVTCWTSSLSAAICPQRDITADSRIFCLAILLLPPDRLPDRHVESQEMELVRGALGQYHRFVPNNDAYNIGRTLILYLSLFRLVEGEDGKGLFTRSAIILG